MDYSTHQIELLEQTPVTSYAMLVPVNNNNGNDMMVASPETICESCSICLEDFQEMDEVRQLLGCHHVFHRECIDHWLAKAATCPRCRQKVA